MTSTEENLVVEVRFEIEKEADGYPQARDSELLLCKPLDPDCTECVVASVPFYLRNVAYGDTIRTTESPANVLRFKEIVGRGGYSVYRVLLHDQNKRDELVARLLDSDALIEQDKDLIAFALPPTADSDAIIDYVLAGKQHGFWGAQDGYVFEN
jgi:hypothetical protein